MTDATQAEKHEGATPEELAKRENFERLYSNWHAAMAAFHAPGPDDDKHRDALAHKRDAAEMALLIEPAPLSFCVWLEGARAAIARLTKAQSVASPYEAQLSQLDEQAAQSLRLWSADDGDAPPPVQDVERRAALERKIAEARSTADAARRAQPSKEGEFMRASN